MGKSGRLYREESVDYEVEIDVDDVCKFIEFHATPSDLSYVKRTFKKMSGELPPSNVTLLDEMKTQLLIKAHKEMGLNELEERLGMTYI